MPSQAKILIAGGSGLIGSAFSREAIRKGYLISLLTRNKKMAKNEGAFNEVLTWVPQYVIRDHANRTPLVQMMNGSDIVMNLAGSSIASGRLNQEHIQNIRESRLLSTYALLQAYSECTRKPRLWIQASAVGFYGDRQEEILTENSQVGSGQLSQVCQKWENTILNSTIIISGETRVIILRIGMVLANHAQAWKKMVLPIKLNLGGALGSGRQWYPWIHIKDLVNAVFHLINNTKKEGVFNLTAPEPIRQKDMAKNIASRLKRMAIFPVPGFILKTLMGNLANELILASTRAIPERLLENKYSFHYANFEKALGELLS